MNTLNSTNLTNNLLKPIQCTIRSLTKRSISTQNTSLDNIKEKKRLRRLHKRIIKPRSQLKSHISDEKVEISLVSSTTSKIDEVEDSSYSDLDKLSLDDLVNLSISRENARSRIFDNDISQSIKTIILNGFEDTSDASNSVTLENVDNELNQTDISDQHIPSSTYNSSSPVLNTPPVSHLPSLSHNNFITSPHLPLFLPGMYDVNNNILEAIIDNLNLNNMPSSASQHISSENSEETTSEPGYGSNNHTHMSWLVKLNEVEGALLCYLSQGNILQAYNLVIKYPSLIRASTHFEIDALGAIQNTLDEYEALLEHDDRKPTGHYPVLKMLEWLHVSLLNNHEHNRAFTVWSVMRDSYSKVLDYYSMFGISLPPVSAIMLVPSITSLTFIADLDNKPTFSADYSTPFDPNKTLSSDGLIDRLLVSLGTMRGSAALQHLDISETLTFSALEGLQHALQIQARNEIQTALHEGTLVNFNHLPSLADPLMQRFYSFSGPFPFIQKRWSKDHLDQAYIGVTTVSAVLGLRAAEALRVQHRTQQSYADIDIVDQQWKEHLKQAPKHEDNEPDESNVSSLKTPLSDSAFGQHGVYRFSKKVSPSVSNLSSNKKNAIPSVLTPYGATSPVSRHPVLLTTKTEKLVWFPHLTVPHHSDSYFKSSTSSSSPSDPNSQNKKRFANDSKSHSTIHNGIPESMLAPSTVSPHSPTYSLLILTIRKTLRSLSFSPSTHHIFDMFNIDVAQFSSPSSLPSTVPVTPSIASHSQSLIITVLFSLFSATAQHHHIHHFLQHLYSMHTHNSAYAYLHFFSEEFISHLLKYIVQYAPPHIALSHLIGTIQAIFTAQKQHRCYSDDDLQNKKHDMTQSYTIPRQPSLFTAYSTTPETYNSVGRATFGSMYNMLSFSNVFSRPNLSPTIHPDNGFTTFNPDARYPPYCRLSSYPFEWASPSMPVLEEDAMNTYFKPVKDVSSNALRQLKVQSINVTQSVNRPSTISSQIYDMYFAPPSLLTLPINNRPSSSKTDFQIIQDQDFSKEATWSSFVHQTLHILSNHRITLTHLRLARDIAIKCSYTEAELNLNKLIVNQPYYDRKSGLLGSMMGNSDNISSIGSKWLVDIAKHAIHIGNAILDNLPSSPPPNSSPRLQCDSLPFTFSSSIQETTVAENDYQQWISSVASHMTDNAIVFDKTTPLLLGGFMKADYVCLVHILRSVAAIEAGTTHRDDLCYDAYLHAFAFLTNQYRHVDLIQTDQTPSSLYTTISSVHHVYSKHSLSSLSPDLHYALLLRYSSLNDVTSAVTMTIHILKNNVQISKAYRDLLYHTCSMDTNIQGLDPTIYEITQSSPLTFAHTHEINDKFTIRFSTTDSSSVNDSLPSPPSLRHQVKHLSWLYSVPIVSHLKVGVSHHAREPLKERVIPRRTNQAVYRRNSTNRDFTELTDPVVRVGGATVRLVDNTVNDTFTPTTHQRKTLTSSYHTPTQTSNYTFTSELPEDHVRVRELLETDVHSNWLGLCSSVERLEVYRKCLLIELSYLPSSTVLPLVPKNLNSLSTPWSRVLHRDKDTQLSNGFLSLAHKSTSSVMPFTSLNSKWGGSIHHPTGITQNYPSLHKDVSDATLPINPSYSDLPLGHKYSYSVKYTLTESSLIDIPVNIGSNNLLPLQWDIDSFKPLHDFEIPIRVNILEDQPFKVLLLNGQQGAAYPEYSVRYNPAQINELHSHYLPSLPNTPLKEGDVDLVGRIYEGIYVYKGGVEIISDQLSPDGLSRTVHTQDIWGKLLFRQTYVTKYTLIDGVVHVQHKVNGVVDSQTYRKIKFGLVHFHKAKMLFSDLEVNKLAVNLKYNKFAANMPSLGYGTSLDLVNGKRRHSHGLGASDRVGTKFGSEIGMVGNSDSNLISSEDSMLTNNIPFLTKLSYAIANDTHTKYMGEIKFAIPFLPSRSKSKVSNSSNIDNSSIIDSFISKRVTGNDLENQNIHLTTSLVSSLIYNTPHQIVVKHSTNYTGSRFNERVCTAENIAVQSLADTNPSNLTNFYSSWYDSFINSIAIPYLDSTATITKPQPDHPSTDTSDVDVSSSTAISNKTKAQTHNTRNNDIRFVRSYLSMHKLSTIGNSFIHATNPSIQPYETDSPSSEHLPALPMNVEAFIDNTTLNHLDSSIQYPPNLDKPQHRTSSDMQYHATTAAVATRALVRDQLEYMIKKTTKNRHAFGKANEMDKAIKREILTHMENQKHVNN